MASADSFQPPPLPNAVDAAQATPPPIPPSPPLTSPPPAAPPPPPAPTPTPSPRNTLGNVALTLVIIAAVFTPTGICGLPLVILIPLGLLGGLLGLISLYKAPRWPGVVSILLLIVCKFIWIATIIGIIAFVSKVGQRIKHEINRELDRTQERMNRGDDSQQRPPPTPDHIATLSAAASALSNAVEAQRHPDGSAPTLVNLSESAGVQTKHQIDPWGHAYRYRLNATSRGYTFISDGPDGAEGTPDDIDLFDLGASIRSRAQQ